MGKQTKKAVIRHAGPLLEISLDGESPLPAVASRKLEKALQYVHTNFNYGRQGRLQQSLERELRRLYTYDKSGRLVCQSGFLFKVKNLLRDAGFEPQYVLLDEDKRRKLKPRWDRVIRNFEFRPRQRECLESIVRYPGGIIDAPPAFGKTYIMAMIAVMFPDAKIDIVTQRKSVVATIRSHLLKWIPDVGQVGGGKKKQARVTIYTARSLHHSDYNADILLADEAHELVTESIAPQLGRYWYSRNYGFTATPDTRLDNAHVRLEGLFGPRIFQLTQQEAESSGLVTPIVVYWVDVSETRTRVDHLQSLVAKKRRGIWRHEERNKVIAEQARKHLDNDRQVLILVDTVEHALNIKRVLPEASLCYSEGSLDDRLFNDYVKAGFMKREERMTSERREYLRKAFENREIK